VRDGLDLAPRLDRQRRRQLGADELDDRLGDDGELAVPAGISKWWTMLLSGSIRDDARPQRRREPKRAALVLLNAGCTSHDASLIGLS
jgi:hypothetical protein